MAWWVWAIIIIIVGSSSFVVGAVFASSSKTDIIEENERLFKDNITLKNELNILRNKANKKLNKLI